MKTTLQFFLHIIASGFKNHHDHFAGRHHFLFIFLFAAQITGCGKIELMTADLDDEASKNTNSTKLIISTNGNKITIPEGQVANISFNLNRATITDTPIDWNINGGKSEFYFSSSIGNTNIISGANQFTIQLPSIQNDIYDKNKNFNLNISGSTLYFANNVSMVVEIIDDDPEPVITHSAAARSAYAGNSAQFALSLSRPSADPISASWKIDETQTSTSHFDISSGSVYFEAYTTTTTLTIPLKVTSTTNPDVNYTIELSNPVGIGTFTQVPRLPGIIMNPVLPVEVTINESLQNTDPSNILPVYFDVFFHRPIDPNEFTISDIQQNGTATGLEWTIIDSGDHQHFSLKLNATATDGTVIPSIIYSTVLSDLGKSNLNSTSTDNQIVLSTTPSAPLLTLLLPSLSNTTSQATITGLADAFTETVGFYSTSNCLETSRLGLGSYLEFTGAGIILNFTANTTTPIYARAFANAKTSNCVYLTAFTHDNVAPTSVSVSINSGAEYTRSTSGTLSISANNAQFAYVTTASTCLTGGSYFQYTAGPINLSVATPANQTTTYYVKFKDDAGNETSCLGDSIIMDTIEPNAPSFTSTNPTSPGNSLTPKIYGTANSVDTATVSIYSDSLCTTTALGNGSKADFEATGTGITLNTLAVHAPTSLYGVATDKAGNWSACVFLTNYITKGFWAHLTGGTGYNDSAIFGTQGVASAANTPQSLYFVSATPDNNGNFWIFGGGNSYNPFDYWNTLWKWDQNQWTWVSGGTSVNEIANYGTINVAATSNTIGSRMGAFMWKDNTNNIYVFGGRGYNDITAGSSGHLNDLWKYSISDNLWTWIKGSKSLNVNTITGGTRKVTDSANTPNSRRNGCGAVDTAGNFWFFGGWGHDPVQTKYWRDLWKFDGTNWTWMSGDFTPSTDGTYGTKGIANMSNQPGARMHCAAWMDANNNFWIFGGEGHTTQGTFMESMNDLWKYDIATDQWTWVTGGSIGYGTDSVQYDISKKGIPSANYTPGPRKYMSYWRDSSGNFWLYGGSPESINPSLALSTYNDLWRFNPTTLEWTWVDGDPANLNVPAIYGTLGTPASTNTPGGRFSTSVGFVEPTSGLFQIFGGNMGTYNTGSLRKNDLWQYGF